MAPARLLLITIGFCLTGIVSCSNVEPAIPDYIDPEQRSVLKAWLNANPTYQVATDKDCKCADEIDEVRKGQGDEWGPNPDYHPYYVSGDLNDDKKTDFAVILATKEKDPRHFLAVFNGPYKPGAKPAYLAELPNDMALFFVPPGPKATRLLVGPFASEGMILEPRGTTYEFEVRDDEEDG